MTYLQYVQPTGNRSTYTNTGIYVDDTEFEFSFDYLYFPEQITSGDWSECIGTGYPNKFRFGSNPAIFMMYGGSTSNATASTLDGQVTINKNGLWENNVQLISYTATTPVGSYLTIGGDYDYPSDALVKSETKLGRFKVYHNNVLVGDFVPAEDNGVVGWYDEVGQTFYDSDGASPWIAGPPLTPAIDKFIYMGEDEVIDAYMGTDKVIMICMGEDLIYSAETPTPPTPVYSAMPFTIEMLSAGTLEYSSLNDKKIRYSINGGEPVQKNFTSSDKILTISGLSAGDKIAFTVPNDITGPSINTNYSFFTSGCTAPFIAYGNMMSLQQVDFMNATEVLGKGAFQRIFYNIDLIMDASNLILPDVTLTQNCCKQMFSYAHNVVGSPQLLPKTLAANCYQNMFPTCSSLSQIKCLATDISATSCVSGWAFDVAQNGTFIKAAGVTWPSGGNGIPTGWTVQEV